MAYYQRGYRSSNGEVDIQEVKQLATDGNLVFSLKTFEGTRTLDIRKYFFKKDTKEFLPTTKGITVTEKTYRTICNILSKNEKEIEEWFEEGKNEIDVNTVNQRQALEDNKLMASDVKHSEDAWRTPTFYEAQSQGGENEIVYNTQHPFYANLKQLVEDIRVNDAQAALKVEAIIDIMLSTLHQAEGLFDNTPVISPESLLETLTYNWGMILANALKSNQPT